MGSIWESVPTAKSSSPSTAGLNSIPPFRSKAYDMVNDSLTNDV
ncbi:unnamed protein product [Arabidopsis halleri]